MFLRQYGLKPHEVDALPLQVAKWLSPIDKVIKSIENGA